MNEREAFARHLQSNPYDRTAHLAYGDWLEEHGFDDEAAWQHSWTPERQQAEDWLHDFARKCGGTCTNYDSEDREDLSWQQITYEMVVQAGHDYVDKGKYFVQVGSEQARSLMWSGNNAAEYWRCWELVTGRKKDGSKDPWGSSNAPFCCSC